MEEILHHVGMSEKSHIMTVKDLEKGYQKFNELAHGLTYRDLSRVLFSLNVDLIFMLSSDNPGQWGLQTRLAFQFHVLVPIQKVISLLFPDREFAVVPLDKKYKNLVNHNDKANYKAGPDLMFSVDRKPVVCFEVKYPHIKFFDKKHFVPVFTQAIYQCLCAKTRYGVITDYFTTMIFRIELEEEDFEEIRENTYSVKIGESTLRLKRLRIAYVMVNNDQNKDMLTAIVAQHIAMAHEEMLDDKRRDICERGMEDLAKSLTLTDEELKRRGDAYAQFFSKFLDDQLGQGGSSVFDKVLDTSDYAVLQEGKANSQVLKIGKSLFEEIITGKTASADNFILKIFDPVHGEKNHGDFTYSMPSYMNFTKKTALKEYEVYQVLEGI